jgi:hypothetical protein
MVEQEVPTQGIKMSRGVELILVTRKKTVILPRIELIVAKGVHVAVKMKYNEPRFSQ